MTIKSRVFRELRLAARKAVACGLVCAFAITQVAVAAPAAAPVQAAARAGTAAVERLSVEDVIRDPAQLQIPFEHMSMSEFHQGTNGKLIIHIQDAHSNLSGQESLAKGLDFFMQRYDIPLVLVEGGDRDVTLDEVKKVTDSKTWQQLAKRFLYDGIVSGEEYLNLTTDHPMRLLGIEYPELYQRNLEAYAKLVNSRQEILVYLHRIQMAIEHVKNKLYPKNLLEYEISKKSGAADQGFVKQFKQLQALASQAKITTDQFGELKQLGALQLEEEVIDFKQVQAEQSELLKELARKVGSRQIQALIEQSRNSKNSQVSQYLALNQIYALAQQYKIPIERFKVLARYRTYLESFSKLDFAELFDEIEELEAQVYESYLGSDNAKRLRALDRYVLLLSKGYQIQLSSWEYEVLMDNQSDYPTVAWQGFMNELLKDYKFFEDIIPYKPMLDETFSDLQDFYAVVSERDEAFLENADRLLTQEKREAAFLIAGGYHTQHLTELLKSQGYSYIVLTPVVKYETDHAAYEDILLAPLELAKREEVSANLKRVHAVRALARATKDGSDVFQYLIERVGDRYSRGKTARVVQAVQAALERTAGSRSVNQPQVLGARQKFRTAEEKVLNYLNRKLSQGSTDIRLVPIKEGSFAQVYEIHARDADGAEYVHTKVLKISTSEFDAASLSAFLNEDMPNQLAATTQNITKDAGLDSEDVSGVLQDKGTVLGDEINRLVQVGEESEVLKLYESFIRLHQDLITRKGVIVIDATTDNVLTNPVRLHDFDFARRLNQDGTYFEDHERDFFGDQEVAFNVINFLNLLWPIVEFSRDTATQPLGLNLEAVVRRMAKDNIPIANFLIRILDSNNRQVTLDALWTYWNLNDEGRENTKNIQTAWRAVLISISQDQIAADLKAMILAEGSRSINQPQVTGTSAVIGSRLPLPDGQNNFPIPGPAIELAKPLVLKYGFGESLDNADDLKQLQEVLELSFESPSMRALWSSRTHLDSYKECVHALDKLRRGIPLSEAEWEPLMTNVRTLIFHYGSGNAAQYSDSEMGTLRKKTDRFARAAHSIFSEDTDTYGKLIGMYIATIAGGMSLKPVEYARYINEYRKSHYAPFRLAPETMLQSQAKVLKDEVYYSRLENLLAALVDEIFPAMAEAKRESLKQLLRGLYAQVEQEQMLDDRFMMLNQIRELVWVGLGYAMHEPNEIPSRIVRAGYMSAGTFRALKFTRDFLSTRGYAGPNVEYDFAGTDVATALLMTDADKLTFRDATPFEGTLDPKHAERLSELYQLEKIYAGYTSTNLHTAIGHAKTPILWELSALGAENITVERMESTGAPSYEISFDWAYDGQAENMRRRNLIYHETHIKGDSHFPLIETAIEAPVYLRKASHQWSLPRNVLSPIIISFGPIDDQPGYERITLNQLPGFPGGPFLPTEEDDYVSVKNVTILMRQDSVDPANPSPVAGARSVATLRELIRTNTRMLLVILSDHPLAHERLLPLNVSELEPLMNAQEPLSIEVLRRTLATLEGVLEIGTRYKMGHEETIQEEFEISKIDLNRAVSYIHLILSHLEEIEPQVDVSLQRQPYARVSERLLRAVQLAFHGMEQYISLRSEDSEDTIGAMIEKEVTFENVADITRRFSALRDLADHIEEGDPRTLPQGDAERLVDEITEVVQRESFATVELHTSPLVLARQVLFEARQQFEESSEIMQTLKSGARAHGNRKWTKFTRAKRRDIVAGATHIEKNGRIGLITLFKGSMRNPRLLVQFYLENGRRDGHPVNLSAASLFAKPGNEAIGGDAYVLNDRDPVLMALVEKQAKTGARSTRSWKKFTEVTRAEIIPGSTYIEREGRIGLIQNVVLNRTNPRIFVQYYRPNGSEDGRPVHVNRASMSNRSAETVFGEDIQILNQDDPELMVLLEARTLVQDSASISGVSSSTRRTSNATRSVVQSARELLKDMQDDAGPVKVQYLARGLISILDAGPATQKLNAVAHLIDDSENNPLSANDKKAMLDLLKAFLKADADFATFPVNAIDATMFEMRISIAISTKKVEARNVDIGLEKFLNDLIPATRQYLTERGMTLETVIPEAQSAPPVATVSNTAAAVADRVAHEAAKSRKNTPRRKIPEGVRFLVEMMREDSGGAEARYQRLRDGLAMTPEDPNSATMWLATFALIFRGSETSVQFPRQGNLLSDYERAAVGYLRGQFLKNLELEQSQAMQEAASFADFIDHVQAEWDLANLGAQETQMVSIMKQFAQDLILAMPTQAGARTVLEHQSLSVLPDFARQNIYLVDRVELGPLLAEQKGIGLDRSNTYRGYQDPNDPYKMWIQVDKRFLLLRSAIQHLLRQNAIFEAHRAATRTVPSEGGVPTFGLIDPYVEVLFEKPQKRFQGYGVYVLERVWRHTSEVAPELSAAVEAPGGVDLSEAPVGTLIEITDRADKHVLRKDSEENVTIWSTIGSGTSGLTGKLLDIHVEEKVDGKWQAAPLWIRPGDRAHLPFLDSDGAQVAELRLPNFDLSGDDEITLPIPLDVWVQYPTGARQTLTDEKLRGEMRRLVTRLIKDGERGQQITQRLGVGYAYIINRESLLSKVESLVSGTSTVIQGRIASPQFPARAENPLTEAEILEFANLLARYVQLNTGYEFPSFRDLQRLTIILNQVIRREKLNKNNQVTAALETFWRDLGGALGAAPKSAAPSQLAPTDGIVTIPTTTPSKVSIEVSPAVSAFVEFVLKKSSGRAERLERLQHLWQYKNKDLRRMSSLQLLLRLQHVFHGLSRHPVFSGLNVLADYQNEAIELTRQRLAAIKGLPVSEDLATTNYRAFIEAIKATHIKPKEWEPYNESIREDLLIFFQEIDAALEIAGARHGWDRRKEALSRMLREEARHPRVTYARGKALPYAFSNDDVQELHFVEMGERATTHIVVTFDNRLGANPMSNALLGETIQLMVRRGIFRHRILSALRKLQKFSLKSNWSPKRTQSNFLGLLDTLREAPNQDPRYRLAVLSDYLGLGLEVPTEDERYKVLVTRDGRHLPYAYSRDDELVQRINFRIEGINHDIEFSEDWNLTHAEMYQLARVLGILANDYEVSRTELLASLDEVNQDISRMKALMSWVDAQDPAQQPVEVIQAGELAVVLDIQFDVIPGIAERIEETGIDDDPPSEPDGSRAGDIANALRKEAQDEKIELNRIAAELAWVQRENTLTRMTTSGGLDMDMLAWPIVERVFKEFNVVEAELATLIPAISEVFKSEVGKITLDRLIERVREEARKTRQHWVFNFPTRRLGALTDEELFVGLRTVKDGIEVIQKQGLVIVRQAADLGVDTQEIEQMIQGLSADAELLLRDVQNERSSRPDTWLTSEQGLWMRAMFSNKDLTTLRTPEEAARWLVEESTIEESDQVQMHIELVRSYLKRIHAFNDGNPIDKLKRGETLRQRFDQRRDDILEALAHEERRFRRASEELRTPPVINVLRYHAERVRKGDRIHWHGQVRTVQRIELGNVALEGVRDMTREELEGQLMDPDNTQVWFADPPGARSSMDLARDTQDFIDDIARGENSDAKFNRLARGIQRIEETFDVSKPLALFWLVFKGNAASREFPDKEDNSFTDQDQDVVRRLLREYLLHSKVIFDIPKSANVVHMNRLASTKVKHGNARQETLDAVEEALMLFVEHIHAALLTYPNRINVGTDTYANASPATSQRNAGSRVNLPEAFEMLGETYDINHSAIYDPLKPPPVNDLILTGEYIFSDMRTISLLDTQTQPLIGSSEGGSQGIFLAHVDPQAHPDLPKLVAYKKFSEDVIPSEMVSELEVAQLLAKLTRTAGAFQDGLSVTGPIRLFPAVFGVVKDDEGKIIGYAFEVIDGSDVNSNDFENLVADVIKLIYIQFETGILFTGDVMRTRRDQAVVLVDAGEPRAIIRKRDDFSKKVRSINDALTSGARNTFQAHDVPENELMDLIMEWYAEGRGELILKAAGTEYRFVYATNGAENRIEVYLKGLRIGRMHFSITANESIRAEAAFGLDQPALFVEENYRGGGIGSALLGLSIRLGAIANVKLFDAIQVLDQDVFERLGFTLTAGENAILDYAKLPDPLRPIQIDHQKILAQKSGSRSRISQFFENQKPNHYALAIDYAERTAIQLDRAAVLLGVYPDAHGLNSVVDRLNDEYEIEVLPRMAELRQAPRSELTQTIEWIRWAIDISVPLRMEIDEALERSQTAKATDRPDFGPYSTDQLTELNDALVSFEGNVQLLRDELVNILREGSRSHRLYRDGQPFHAPANFTHIAAIEERLAERLTVLGGTFGRLPVTDRWYAFDVASRDTQGAALWQVAHTHVSATDVRRYGPVNLGWDRKLRLDDEPKPAETILDKETRDLIQMLPRQGYENFVWTLDGLTPQAGVVTKEFKDMLQALEGAKNFVEGIGGHFSVQVLDEAQDPEGALLAYAESQGFVSSAPEGRHTTFLVASNAASHTLGDETSVLIYPLVTSLKGHVTVPAVQKQIAFAAVVHMHGIQVRRDAKVQIHPQMSTRLVRLTGQTRAQVEAYVSKAATTSQITPDFITLSKPFLMGARVMWQKLNDWARSIATLAWSA